MTDTMKRWEGKYRLYAVTFANGNTAYYPQRADANGVWMYERDYSQPYVSPHVRNNLFFTNKKKAVQYLDERLADDKKEAALLAASAVVSYGVVQE